MFLIMSMMDVERQDRKKNESERDRDEVQLNVKPNMSRNLSTLGLASALVRRSAGMSSVEQ